MTIKRVDATLNKITEDKKKSIDRGLFESGMREPRQSGCRHVRGFVLWAVYLKLCTWGLCCVGANGGLWGR
jgi:hypothetical protein